jgi:hypothetical protein
VSAYYDGDDFLDGGAGIDWVNYGAEPYSVYVYLNSNVARTFVSSNSGGWYTHDTIYNVENVSGSDHADSLMGDDGANVFRSWNDDDWTMSSRPLGVRRAFLSVSIRYSRESLTSGDISVPGSHRMDNLLEVHS